MEGVNVKSDRWGYEVKTCSDDCISAINAYYEQVLSYGRQMSVILQAPAYDANCVLANVLAAHFLFSCDPTRARHNLQAAESRLEQATTYERGVFGAVSYMISKDRDDDVAVDIYFKLLRDFPRDLLSLKRAQILCFYMGRPDLSLDLVLQVLSENQQESYIYGMLAFPLLELGRMTEAEEAARKGFQIKKQDCWAQHALCHVLQYKCQLREAVEFMEECSPSWISCCSFMYTHNWWHVALCYLEGHSSIERVLEIYDHHIWKELERTGCVRSEVYLNALALLLRVYVRGGIETFGDRLDILAGCLIDQANWHVEWHLDVLILWALASIGEFSKAEELLKSLKFRTSSMNKKKQQLMQRGVCLAEALYWYGRGNNKQALEILGLDFDARKFKIIGASDEQLDVFNEVWYSILLNTGQIVKAIEVIEKQIQNREVPFLWHLLARSYKLAGSQEATIADQKARALENAFFN